MAGWASNNQKLSAGVMNEYDVVWKPKFSQKFGVELMQNCDLPPPQKVFSGSDETVISSMNRVCGMMGREDDGEYEKLELLKALRLSQTRAREAERRAESLAKEKDFIANVLIKESLELFACRQWVKLLEVQVLMLQPHRQRPEKMGCRWGSEEEGDDDGEGISWIVALAICLGIAGVGVAFGCRYWL
ncbi:hypothetical protein HS088_TW13G00906 [Tripterygium wilfordii]|uniref:Uncharacterized protein n=1 Tax=Tripterygium wilfordii TaxID=458696 RepID=A0A7J7CVC3_TRIWF|nr:uncharacterized protein LOC120012831 [Tripterygium wilfordii]KAF5738013.1 hypothetical protein HS088_TW13G00906 [Tripterygium wilfordii]